MTRPGRYSRAGPCTVLPIRFSPRYSDRYMPDEDGVSEYAAHSYRFGGPWVMMKRLGDLAPGDLTFLKGQLQNFKDGRASISQGKVFHLEAPSLYATDAIQSYDAVIRFGRSR